MGRGRFGFDPCTDLLFTFTSLVGDLHLVFHFSLIRLAFLYGGLCSEAIPQIRMEIFFVVVFFFSNFFYAPFPQFKI